ncbi:MULTISPECIES: restriction endonuclease [Flavobacterium]|uniref:Restriction endonuclease n=1 Tax=Flavobacterium sedimenticola TaxID=3043286 RepID=A0ABT6XRX5_9FLAO|nr:restriction endonuclease [Flavobacterium sedimenticola]MDI9257844.1 restriction endonuclease [Flavobacterium sedimenticola]
MKVVKHSGSIVDFNRDKLKASLLKSGASIQVVEDVLAAIDKEIYEGISTKKIYKLAFGLLKKTSSSHAARYNLKSALQMLGPTGFFFEKFVARLFQAEGYLTQTNLFLSGKCVGHEIDVVINKNDYLEMIECKFHAKNETNSDVKVPMYILSRFNDIKDRKHLIFTKNDTLSGCWIVTNNRFTGDAMAFAHCSGLQLLSWDYPVKNNLRNRIDQQQLYPVTCLTTLSLAEKDKLLVLDVILAREVLDNFEVLEQIGLSSNRIKNVVKEVSELCKYI